jgi:myosin heavy subunit
MQNEPEMTITCRQCGKEFTFSSSEQEFFKLKGFTLPQHCKACRVDRRSQTSLLCSTCGTEIPRGKPVYCATCLAAMQLGCDLDMKQIQSVLDESKTKLNCLETEKAQQIEELNTKLTTLELEKSQLENESKSRLETVTTEHAKLLSESEIRLNALETEKSRITGVLLQKELTISGLEQRLKDTLNELEKSNKYRISLEKLDPALTNIKDRLEAVERAQNNLGNNLIQLVQNTEKSAENSSLFESIKRLFRPHPHSPTLNG